jgi:hypothetical protein
MKIGILMISGKLNNRCVPNAAFLTKLTQAKDELAPNDEICHCPHDKICARTVARKSI